MCDSTALMFGGSSRVPEHIAVCPECGAPLFAESDNWIQSTGMPTVGLYVNCIDDINCDPRYFRSDWQRIFDAVERWANCQEV
jgi:hypothetical protein